MRRKLMSIVIVVLLLTSMIGGINTSAAFRNISVFLDGTQIEFDVSPQIINSRTMVPLRTIFETLGATVEWDDATKTVLATKDEIAVKMTIGQANININGEDKALDVAPEIVSDRTLVPVRAVAEGLNTDVEWDSYVRVVSIYTKGYQRTKTTLYNPEDEKGVEVDSHLVPLWKRERRNFWYEFPCQYMYRKGSDSIVVGKHEVEAYKKDGWFENVEETFSDQQIYRIAQKYIEVNLGIPHVGAANNGYVIVTIVNRSDYDIYLDPFVFANGYLCYHSFSDEKLSPHKQRTATYFNGTEWSYKKNMYLDKNSEASTTIKLLGKSIYIKFNTEGVISYSLS